MEITKSAPSWQIRRWLGVAAMALAAGTAVTGCTTSSGNPAQQGGGTAAASTDTIRTSFEGDPTTFAPHEVRNLPDYMANRMLFDTLVRRGNDNEIVAGLATEWKIEPQKGVFTLRKDATCSDGTPITPTVVANSLKLFADPAAKSSFRELAFGPGAPTITADDAAGTLTIALAQPWTDLLQGMSLHAAGIVCPAGLADRAGLTAGTVKGAFSGPYTLAKKQHGVSYGFELRSDYNTWAAYSPAPEGTPAKIIDVSINGSSSAVANELVTGTRDIAYIKGKEVERVKADKSLSTTPFPQGNLFIMFNEREGHPFTDPALRKAVAQALNQQAVIAAGGGQGEPYASFAHAAVPCAVTDLGVRIPEDKSAAAAALKGLKINMIGANVFGPNGATNTYVSEALREVGADVKLRNVDIPTWSTDITTKPESWDMTVFGAINAGGTMAGALSTITGKPTEAGGLNWAGAEHPEILQLVQQAMGQQDESDRCATYADIQKEMISETAQVIPLYAEIPVVAARNGFTVDIYNGQIDTSTFRISQ